jgi:hypothetical protein
MYALRGRSAVASGECDKGKRGVCQCGRSGHSRRGVGAQALTK